MSGLLSGMALKTSLSASRKLVLISLSDHATDEGRRVFPSITYTARRASCSRSTVKRVLREFRESGLLVVVREALAQYPTEYRIDVKMLTAMVSDGTETHTRAHESKGGHSEPGSELEPSGGSELEPSGGSELEPLNVIETSSKPSSNNIAQKRQKSNRKFSEWDLTAATALENRLTDVGNLDKPITKKERAEWADEFRKLRKIDDKSQELIAAVMLWLFNVDTFWINEGNFCTAMKLRKKKDGITYFKRFEIQARNSISNGKKGRFNWDVDAAVAEATA